jgi:DNA-3-methyladenine glycosylase I
VIKNARGYLQIEEEKGSFGEFLWSFVGGQTLVHEIHTIKDYPTTNPESEAMSKALKKYGFSFVGPTIVYAFMQAVGMINDHAMDCFRQGEVMGNEEKNNVRINS